MTKTRKKVALITGSGRGIGRSIAVQLAKTGWLIGINDFGDLNPPQTTLDLVHEAGGDGLVLMADITRGNEREKTLRDLIEAFGQIDLLVNNAGIGPRVRMDMLDTTEESMSDVLRVNMIATFFLSQIVAKVMIEQIREGKIKEPKIVNIGSISSYTSSTNRAEYCISKAGVSMITTLFADRLADEGINVYEIRPGIIKTPMTEKVSDKYDQLIANGITPIKRWGLPEDIGKAVVAIAEDYLPFSTGQVIDVDGGFHIRRL